jgi:hypothetical protein
MIILYNPHVDDFLGEPPHFKFLRRRALKKYGFLITEALAKNQEIRVLIDGSLSAFVPVYIFSILPNWLRQSIATIEYKAWLHLNKFGPLVKRIAPPRQQTDDVLMAFSYKSATGNFSLRRDTLEKYKHVIVHLSHYFVSTSEKSENLASLRNVWLAGDSDVTEIQYFKKYFSWYKKSFLILPFAVSSRFTKTKDFQSRKNMCVATGSFHDLTHEFPQSKYEDFMRTTALTTYHPIRKAVFDNADILSDIISCHTSSYRQYGNKSKVKGLLGHLLVGQKKYFSIDIVELYNSYRYAVVGEEVSGFPALGAFEAMACGAVLFAPPKYYSGLGLEFGVHYFPYDETLNGLATSIKRLEGRSENIQTTADAGRKFVEENFRSESIFARWNEVFITISNTEVL